NPYKINPKGIIVGGFSAGAICGLHTAFLRNESEIPSWLTASDTTGMGGVEGNSGNSGYSSEVIAVLNYSGAIGDTTWMDASKYAPTFSVHDDGDDIVPYDTREVYFGGSVPTGLTASGSLHVNDRLNNLGIPSQLVTFNRNSHVSYVNSTVEFDSILDLTKDFLVDNVICTWPTSTESQNSETEKLDVYPNPSRSDITLKLSSNQIKSLQIFDLTGKVVINESFNPISTAVSYDVEGLQPGIYFSKAISTSGKEHTKKFILE
ncbi:MAG: T9SS type A sorting domain-containing protein, partial [Flavobacteriales bacterium]|nr:T9SS type A sorting domain-containing protein [Flavobacteriales bacterium]